MVILIVAVTAAVLSGLLAVFATIGSTRLSRQRQS